MWVGCGGSVWGAYMAKEAPAVPYAPKSVWAASYPSPTGVPPFGLWSGVGPPHRPPPAALWGVLDHEMAKKGGAKKQPPLGKG